jgi:hypothetical protein
MIFVSSQIISSVRTFTCCFWRFNIGRNIKRDEFEWLWKEAIVAHFRMGISKEKLRETNRLSRQTFIQHSNQQGSPRQKE